MNPSEIKEIILQINGTQAEEEIKKLKGIIEGTRQARERFELLLSGKTQKSLKIVPEA